MLYGSAVEFRCHNKTVNNLYEVSKEEYDRFVALFISNIMKSYFNYLHKTHNPLNPWFTVPFGGKEQFTIYRIAR